MSYIAPSRVVCSVMYSGWLNVGSEVRVRVLHSMSVTDRIHIAGMIQNRAIRYDARRCATAVVKQ